MDAIVVIVFVVVTFLEWYHVGGLLSTRISPESDYYNLRGVPNAVFTDLCECALSIVGNGLFSIMALVNIINTEVKNGN